MAEDRKHHLPLLDAGSAPARQDLDEGLRFIHFMEMQMKHDLLEAQSKLYALLEELVAAGKIDLDALEARRQRIADREAARQGTQALVRVSDVRNKYQLADLPEIDCAARIPLCRARCCTFHVALSFQDLDENVLRWDYGNPYVLRHGADGYCVHSEAATRACTVYEKRPATCRTYDCRNDKRIWVDFENRIAAP